VLVHEYSFCRRLLKTALLRDPSAYYFDNTNAAKRAAAAEVQAVAVPTLALVTMEEGGAGHGPKDKDGVGGNTASSHTSPHPEPEPEPEPPNPNFISTMLSLGFSHDEITSELNHIHGAHQVSLSCVLAANNNN
jgi:hypothetical protein